MAPNTPTLPQSPLGTVDESSAAIQVPAGGVTNPPSREQENGWQSDFHNTREQADLEYAMRLSLEHQAKQSNTETNPTRATTKGFSEASTDLVLSLNNEFPMLHDPNGDTVIYIGPPSRMPEQSDREYHYVQRHFSQVHVVHSSTLRLMGSESRFHDKDLLGPVSVRSERKLRKLGVLNAVEAQHQGKFKYYIDLRPATEGEEAVLAITELTCTKGVLTWHLASDKYDLSPFLVMGHDYVVLENMPSTLTFTTTNLHRHHPPKGL